MNQDPNCGLSYHHISCFCCFLSVPLDLKLFNAKIFLCFYSVIFIDITIKMITMSTFNLSTLNLQIAESAASPNSKTCLPTYEQKLISGDQCQNGSQFFVGLES